MLKTNVTLHNVIVMNEQQTSQPGSEQAQQKDNASKGKSSSSFTVLFKQMSHALYLWMD
jgi:hypothetical protein